MALQIPTIPSSQLLSENLSDHRKLPTIEWAREAGDQEAGRKTFSSGSDRTWEWSKKGNLSDKDIWSSESNDGFQLGTKNRHDDFYIAYFDMKEGRQFRGFTQMAFQFSQSAREKGTMYLYNIGREYKNPNNSERWSFSEDADDYNYKGDHGTFFVRTYLDSREIDKQSSGFVLNRIYFHYKTMEKGSSSTGGDIPSAVEIWDLKFGWGNNNSDSYRICLPKIRPFDQADKLIFGD